MENINLALYRDPPNHRYHSFIVPLGISEGPPPPMMLVKSLIEHFGHLEFAVMRLQNAKISVETVEDKGKIVGKRLVVRFDRWASDPAPERTIDEDKDFEGRLKARIDRGNSQ